MLAVDHKHPQTSSGRSPSFGPSSAQITAEEISHTNSHRLLHLLQLFHIHNCGIKTFVGEDEGRVKVEVRKGMCRAAVTFISKNSSRQSGRMANEAFAEDMKTY